MKLSLLSESLRKQAPSRPKNPFRSVRVSPFQKFDQRIEGDNISLEDIAKVVGEVNVKEVDGKCLIDSNSLTYDINKKIKKLGWSLVNET